MGLDKYIQNKHRLILAQRRVERAERKAINYAAKHINCCFSVTVQGTKLVYLVDALLDARAELRRAKRRARK